MPGFFRKLVELRDIEGAPATPSVATCHALTPAAWHPVRNAMAAQDTIPASARRILARAGLQGSFEYPFDQSLALIGISQVYPNPTTWRTIFGPLPRRTTPGTYLETHVLYLPSGNTQVGGGSNWGPGGAQGAIRIRAQWSNGATTSSNYTFSKVLEPSDLPDAGIAATAGQISEAAGAEWPALREALIENIFPPGADEDPATSETYAEWSTVTLEIEIQGGARIVDVVVYERPLRHAQDHNDVTPKSAHACVVGAGVPLSEVTPVPQTEARDGNFYEDHRFGSLQTLRVGSEQNARMGESGVAWGAFVSEHGAWSETAPVLSLSGATSPTPILESTTGYDPDQAGWRVSASYARLYELCESELVMLNGGRAVIPVRVWVDAEWSNGGGGGTVGTLRLQSSDSEWVDVEFRSNGVRETLSSVGWLESQVVADHAHAVLQALYFVDDAADQFEIYGWAFEFGW